ncbi:acetylxylan esterase [Coraliomargarita sp. SDUM461003]|uniref:Acetylxylan esterase n=1 Tax=Thalassobacterium maritimum TaxID=3041265 RepID=A0ABU1AQ93_9BACT|nr:acetylxylan esterase [Coraliomargarita sp. SDUM461003]MDQ8206308.1 acetylxylan esterase [Coraliomargarita sp. SDUM461003]
MKQLLCLFSAVVLLNVCLVAQSKSVHLGSNAIDLNRVHLSFTTDKDPIDYHVNEDMRFTIDLDLGDQELEGEYFVDWKSSSDDGVSDHGRVGLSELPLILTKSMSRPGFVRLQVELLDAQGVALKQDNWEKPGRTAKIAFEGGAGADVDQIQQAVPAPDDFVAFWERQRARLDAVPMNRKVERVESKTPGFDTYAVEVDCAGPRPVTGYITVPTGAADKSLPARVVFYGYGVGPHFPHSGTAGEITFAVNAHGFELAQEQDYYDNFKNLIRSHGEIYGFDPKQNSDPEAAYFNGMALRAMRALEFVKTQPKWDGENLIVKGGSQGGLQSIWAAAQDPDVSLCKVSIIWCANIAGESQDGRLGGWQPKWVPELGYYDVVNYAPYIECPVEITRAALGDYTSPPSGLAAFYNNLDTEKEIVWYQGSTHGYISPVFETFTRSDREEVAVNTAAQAMPREKGKEGWLRAHEQISKSAQRGEVPLLFIGDSITHMMLTNGGPVWREEYRQIGAVNVGLSGDKVENILWRIQNGALGTLKPKVTVLLAGVNNMRKNTPEEIGLGVGAIVDVLKLRLPETKILVLGVFPRGHKGGTQDRETIKEINTYIAQLDDNERVFYLDIGNDFLNKDGSLIEGAMLKDGLHPDLKGYQIWAAAIKDKIAQLSQ